MNYQKIKKRLFEIIQAGKKGDKASKIFDTFLIILILMNVCLVIADTFNLPNEVQIISNRIEVISVIIFTIEYILRIWTADLLYPEKNWFVAKFKYIFSLLAIVDLLAIVPFYLPFLIPIDLRILRMLRIIRLFRVFKINRYTNALSSIINVVKNKQNELLSSIFVVLLLMIVASVLMYSVENKAQPEVFRNAFDALWWALATLTTVGYGDIYPVTTIGRIVTMISSAFGIAIIALPSGVITAGYLAEINKEE